MIFFNKSKTIIAHLALLLLLQSSSLHTKVTDINEEAGLNAVFSSEHDTIIMATSDHCHWCIQTKPHFIQLEEKYESKVKFYSVNGYKSGLQKFLNGFTMNGKHLSTNMLKTLKKHHALGEHQTLEVPGYPIFLYVKHGKIVDIHIGGCSKELLEKFIEKNHK